MQFEDLRKLARAAAHAEKGAPVAYSFTGENGSVENYSAEDLNKALRAEFKKLAPNYREYTRNKLDIFQLIEETIDEVLPAKVEQQYMAFAETKTVGQGEKAIFRKRITEASRQRAKQFVTQVGLAGRYETFMIDGQELEVGTTAIGAACRIGFEEFLDGRVQWADLTDIIVEGMDEYIYREIAKALGNAVESLPTPNKATVAGFDEATMDELLAIADSYGHSTIYCTFEFAAQMKPAEGWASNELKTELWRKGWLGDYKGHTVVIMPQSMKDQTNEEKMIDPSKCYIIPTGTDKPVKLVFEGQTAIVESDASQNADWSTELQTYKKFGIAVLMNHWMCYYENTELSTDTRS